MNIEERWDLISGLNLATCESVQCIFGFKQYDSIRDVVNQIEKYLLRLRIPLFVDKYRSYAPLNHIRN